MVFLNILFLCTCCGYKTYMTWHKLVRNDATNHVYSVEKHVLPTLFGMGVDISKACSSRLRTQLSRLDVLEMAHTHTDRQRGRRLSRYVNKGSHLLVPLSIERPSNSKSSLVLLT